MCCMLVHPVCMFPNLYYKNQSLRQQVPFLLSFTFSIIAPSTLIGDFTATVSYLLPA